MSECKHCNTDKETRTFNGRKLDVCMHTGCIMDRMLAEYEGCAHDLETAGSNLLKCKHCGMGATPSYTQS
jgi:hypothetical protein